MVSVICISTVLKHLSFEFLSFRFGIMLQDLPFDDEITLATVGCLWSLTNIARVHGNP
jgi:hypothetical protein